MHRPKSIAVPGFAPLFLLLALLAPAAGCKTTPPSPYLRVVVPSGRVYYAHEDRLLRSEAGGFLTFRDLVTREHVQLKNGEYVARLCPQREVELRQREYIDDPDSVPMMDPSLVDEP